MWNACLETVSLHARQLVISVIRALGDLDVCRLLVGNCVIFGFAFPCGLAWWALGNA